MLDEMTPPPIGVPREPQRLYPKLLGATWSALDPVVQRVHTDTSLTHAEGVFQVSRAPGRLMELILDVAGVPRSSGGAQVRLVVTHRGLVERWHRSFSGRPLVTIQSEAPGGLLAERIGLFEFLSSLTIKDGELVFRHVRLAIRLGQFRIPLPDWLSFKVAGREGPASATDGAGDQTSVDVRVTGPTDALLFAYRGTVRWRSGEDPA
ncbi:MAG TPA: DUF4166 domain-containing protein [Chloroflexota bacterium]|nr:DUF4166 domain-containing protein [Chloroflexota bacterium]